MSETRINKGWLIKMAIFAVALVGLGVWGLIDALVVYPARGARHAEYLEYQYLTERDAAGELLRASVRDPRETVRDLAQREDQLREDLDSLPAESLSYRSKQAELIQYRWLRALGMIGELEPANTTFDDPRARLDELDAEWSTANQPKPLAAYDIPMQWVFVAIGFGGALWILVIVMRVSRLTYKYDASAHRLALPDGREVTPEDITEVDKRKWDKFFVTLRLRDGAAVKLDLLRYQPLEAWVLEMEKHTEGYEPPKEDAGGEEKASASVGEDGGSTEKA